MTATKGQKAFGAFPRPAWHFHGPCLRAEGNAGELTQVVDFHDRFRYFQSVFKNAWRNGVSVRGPPVRLWANRKPFGVQREARRAGGAGM
jgi:hypothetical protein